MSDLPQDYGTGKMRYVIVGRAGGLCDLFLIRDGDPPSRWKFINLFPSLTHARDAVARYLDAREIARSIGVRL